jgi:hypothetical protein
MIRARAQRRRRSRGAAQRALLALLLASPVACSGDVLVVAEERIEPPPDMGGPDANDSPEVRQPGIGVPASCPGSPGERQGLLGCWPTRQVGDWRGYFIGAPLYTLRAGEGDVEFPPGALWLALGVDGAGTLRFGDASSAEGCDRDPESERCASVGRVLEGFVYRLEDIALLDADGEAPPRIQGEPPLRLGEQMSFVVRLGQPWEGLCPEPSAGAASGGVLPGAEPDAEGAEPLCACGSEICRVTAPYLSMSLVMSEDGEALRGVYTPSDPDLPTARLEFRRP